MNTNRTQIAHMINAIFAMGMSQDILNLSNKESFDFGADARQDVDTLHSALWGKRNELVSLQYVDDKPLYGQGHVVGAQLTPELTGVPDERAVEREAAIKAVSYEIAVIERHILSLEKQLVSDTEEAGKSWADGSNIRNERKGMQYKPRLKSTWDALIDLKVKAQPLSQWLSRICLAQDELELPHVSAQDATDYFNDLVSDEDIDRMSTRAWDSLLAKYEEAGALLSQHDSFMFKFNGCSDSEKEDWKEYVALENKTFKKEFNSCKWWIDTILIKPQELLRHSATPSWLTDSPEWRTQVAKIKTAAAMAATAEALANVAEVEALCLQTKANMALLDARDLQIKCEEQLEQQQEAMRKRLNPTPLVVEAIPQPMVEEAASVPAAKRGRAPRTINNKGAAGFAH